ncbi:hypothetical protein AB0C96_38935 [Streptomyces sp. NPDC048506]|uniref:hypothetical protein n=1 Tax=Streptomyces sp. NPDC048506 TaxID=3155028 RepID=UPI00342AC729
MRRLSGDIEHCQTLRLDNDGDVTQEKTGPGSAWMELMPLSTGASASSLLRSPQSRPARQLSVWGGPFLRFYQQRFPAGIHCPATALPASPS